MRTTLCLVLLLYLVSAAPFDNDGTHIHEEYTFQNHRDAKIFGGIWRSLVQKITQTVDTGSTTTVATTTSRSTTTSAPTTTPPKLPIGAEDVGRYDVCTTGPYLLEADCFCGTKEKGEGKICHEGSKCNHQDKNEGLICKHPDNVDNFPCDFNDRLLLKILVVDGQPTGFNPNELFSWRKEGVEGNLVPFYYSQTPSAGDRNLLQIAMKKIEDKTCFRFKEEKREVYEKDQEKHILEIFIENYKCTISSGSVSTVAFYPHKLKLSLSSHITDDNGNDCGNLGVVTHELMHALGMGHTQKRSDRKDYIDVDFSNIPLNIKEQYTKSDELILFDSIPYDCGSIMHYGTHYDGKQVIVPKENCKLKEKNNAYYGPDATAKDYELLNIIGKCAGECYYQKEDGKDYDGRTDKTKSGFKCEKWNSQIPREHNYGKTKPDEGNHNFCRNPSNGDKPWCYHSNGGIWEYCDIPYCGSEEYLKAIQKKYP